MLEELPQGDNQVPDEVVAERGWIPVPHFDQKLLGQIYATICTSALEQTATYRDVITVKMNGHNKKNDAKNVFDS